MKTKLLTYTLLALTLLFACNKNYEYATIDEQAFLAYSAGIFTNIAKVDDTTGFSIALGKDSSYYLVRVSARGDLKLVRNISEYFQGKWELDSIYDIRMGYTGGYLVFWQEPKYYSNPYPRIIVLDTAGNEHANFLDSMQTDSLIQQYELIIIPNPQTINAYYLATDTSYTARFLYIQKYNTEGQVVDATVKNLLNNTYLNGVFDVDGNFGFVLNSDTTDTIYVGIIDYLNDELRYFKYGGGIYYWTQAVALSPTKALLVFVDQQERFYIAKANFDALGFDWFVTNDKFYGLLVTSAFEYNNTTVLLGTKFRFGVYDFAYPYVLDVGGFFKLTALNSDGSYLWEKDFIYERMIPIGYLQQNDTTYTSFSYGRTFKTYPATYVLKFNQFGKIY